MAPRRTEDRCHGLNVALSGSRRGSRMPCTAPHLGVSTLRRRLVCLAKDDAGVKPRIVATIWTHDREAGGQMPRMRWRGPVLSQVDHHLDQGQLWIGWSSRKPGAGLGSQSSRAFAGSIEIRAVPDRET